MQTNKRTYADRPRRPQGPRISPLASFSAEAVRILAQRFALLPKDEHFALNRVLALAIVSTDGTRVRVMKGTLLRRVSGGNLTLCDEDLFVIGRNVSPSQVLAWSTDSCDQLEASTSKALRIIQGEIDAVFMAEFAALIEEINTPGYVPAYLSAA